MKGDCVYSKCQLIEHEQTELNLKIKELEQNLSHLNTVINDVIAKQIKFLNVIKNYELYVTATKILKIFNKNQLKSRKLELNLKIDV